MKISQSIAAQVAENFMPKSARPSNVKQSNFKDMAQPQMDAMIEAPVVSSRGRAAHPTTSIPLSAPIDKPIFQLCSLPLVINSEDYIDPVSNSNPGGSYDTLYSFSQLVNKIPKLERSFFASGMRISDLYGNIVKGANTAATASFTQMLLSDAQQQYRNYALQNINGIPGIWYPAYATPYDWYDVAKTDRFKLIEVAEDDSANQGDIVVIGEDDTADRFDIRVKQSDGTSQQIKMSGNSTVKSIEFRGFMVQITRPWLSFQIFSTYGWFLGGQKEGFCSTGAIKNNSGVFPLLPTSFIVGCDLTIKGDWDRQDLNLLSSSKANHADVSIGPFQFKGDDIQVKGKAVELNSTSDTLQVIGWLSQLVPLSPQTDG